MPALVDDATIERMKERATAAMAAAKEKYPERTILRGVGVVSSPRATDSLPTSKSLKELTGPPQVKGLSAKVKAARERAAVAAKRKAKFGVTSNHVGDVQKGHRSLLEKIRISKTTAAVYKQNAFSFRRWAEDNKLALEPTRMLGLSLLEYLDVLFLEGFGLSAIAATRAGVMHLVPELSTHHDIVERLKDAQESWAKRAPAPARLPMPRYGAWPTIGAAAALGFLRESLGFATMLDTYIRPSELLKILAEDVIEPSPLDEHGPAAKYGLVLNSAQFARGDPVGEEDLAASKAGSYNENILFDLKDEIWLGKALARLAHGQPKKSLLFPWSREHLNKVFKLSVDW